MKIIFEKPMYDKVVDLINRAQGGSREISHISVTPNEMISLNRELREKNNTNDPGDTVMCVVVNGVNIRRGRG